MTQRITTVPDFDPALGDVDFGPMVAVFHGEKGLMYYQIPPPVQDQLDRIEAMLTALTAAKEPPGYVVAPLEPTEAMIEAGAPWTGAHHGPCDPNECAADTYRAMLAARPDDEGKP